MKTPLSPLILAIAIQSAAALPPTGEPKQWHKLTFDFHGPETSETATPNPFTDYRLDVTFHHPATGKTLVVPGYYAADGQTADSSATGGTVWRAHFAPEETGTWTYTASFRSGPNVATNDPAAAASAGFFDGESGGFEIGPSDKGGRDFRGKGRLDYVGKHHLRHAGSGEWFMKAGVDSPENLLAYGDFDGDFKTDLQKDHLVKSWAPHVGDWREGDPQWRGGKGKGLIGAINYLASEGLNAFSFIPMNINGDDCNVFPYTTYAERSRFDVSKLAQWEIVFEHGTRMGMHLHFKTQETENELLLDGGNLGDQRKLYYRELIARFGHHLALNWNLGEEINDATTAQKVAWAQFIHDTDPYHHPIVIHNGDSHYELLGSASKLTGFSRQMNEPTFIDTFPDVKNYVDRSAAAGKPWVVAADEPGNASDSLRPDSNPGTSHDDARKHALWATIMAGGAGCEFYFGSNYADSDMTCQDFRSRDRFWDCCRFALLFLRDAGVPFERMKNRNPLVSGNGPNLNRCLAAEGDAYLVHLPAGGGCTLDLTAVAGPFAVTWLDPRTGATVRRPDVNGGGIMDLGSPPSEPLLDWVVYVRTLSAGGLNQAPVVDAGPDRTQLRLGPSVTLTMAGTAQDDLLPAGSVITRAWSQVTGPAAVTFALPGDPATKATFTEAGTYRLRLAATDGELEAADEVTVTIIPTVVENFPATHDAYTNNGTNSNNTMLRLENGTNQRISYLQFDLGTLPSPPVSAILRLTEDNDPSSGTMTLRVHAAASNDWTETTLSGSNAPAKAAELAFFTGNITDGLAIDFNVTSHLTGPGTYSFVVSADPSSRNVNLASAENLIAALQPRLIVTTIEGTFNQPPAVSAGPDQTKILEGDPVLVDLAGTATDDGLPEGSALTLAWTQVSGPAPVMLADPASAATPATFTETGTYVLRLSGSDGEKSAGDDVTIRITPPPVNQAPVVLAGTDQTVVLSAESVTANLAGAMSDDGLPKDSPVTALWTLTSGPGEVSFGDPTSAATTATFTAYGDYVVKLTASDGEFSAADEVQVTVTPPPVNQPPVVNAGADRAAALDGRPVSLSLAGSATDDGLPAGSGLGWSWTQTSGPATVTFSSPATAATQATFSAAGTYLLRLTVSDGELSAFDEVAVTISAAPPTPVAFSPTHDAYLQDAKAFNNGDLRAEFAARIRTSYLQFDLAAFGSTPSGARLRLVESSDTSDGVVTLRLFAALSNAWSETNLTGGNAPAKGPEIASFTGDVRDGQVVEFDVGARVTAPGVYSFILEMSTKNRDVAFASAENKTVAARPVLLVTPSTPGAAASRMALMTVVPSPVDPPQLRITVGRQATTLSLRGAPDTRYAIERSIDLTHWTPLTTLDSGPSGELEFTDPDEPASKAFYRAIRLGSSGSPPGEGDTR